jgi:predicted phosphate transport protein (TIGR00153 family)|tara:strand:+ start:643 stop:1257 length:615 start_codon:yes stop_codon:yes gene_type:complete
METCERCVLGLVPFFEAVSGSDWADAEKRYRAVSDLEGDADELKKKVRLNLPRSLFLPVSRNHLLEIVQVQDRIANGAKDIAGLMLGRKMRFPEEVKPALTEFVKASLDAVSLARKVIAQLNDLVTTGFSGREIELVEKMLEELDDAEHKSDVLQVKLRRALFDHEADLNPVSVIFLYRVIDQIGDIADDAQTVGNRMMYVIAS